MISENNQCALMYVMRPGLSRGSFITQPASGSIFWETHPRAIVSQPLYTTQLSSTMSKLRSRKNQVKSVSRAVVSTPSGVATRKIEGMRAHAVGGRRVAKPSARKPLAPVESTAVFDTAFDPEDVDDPNSGGGFETPDITGEGPLDLGGRRQRKKAAKTYKVRAAIFILLAVYV
jgi:hypothetical protein